LPAWFSGIGSHEQSDYVPDCGNLPCLLNTHPTDEISTQSCKQSTASSRSYAALVHCSAQSSRDLLQTDSWSRILCPGETLRVLPASHFYPLGSNDNDTSPTPYERAWILNPRQSCQYRNVGRRNGERSATAQIFVIHLPRVRTFQKLHFGYVEVFQVGGLETYGVLWVWVAGSGEGMSGPV
jgi:hypothetical protein